MLRRDGCPLVVVSDDGRTVYEEGKDYLPLRDVRLGQDPYAGEYSFQHSGLKHDDRVMALSLANVAAAQGGRGSILF